MFGKIEQEAPMTNGVNKIEQEFHAWMKQPQTDQMLKLYPMIELKLLLYAAFIGGRTAAVEAIQAGVEGRCT